MEAKDCKILIIDDVPTNVALLSEIVKTINVKYDVAYGGAEAIEKIESFKPNLVLCDLMMPGVNGWDVIKAIRSKYTKKEMCIIVTSALTDHDNISECYALGINDYVAKPIVPNRIMNSIMVHMEEL